MTHDSPAILLVRPQLGENIGAAARAMSNFGLADLRLVAPRDGWPNAKAYEMAANAAGILDGARVYADMAAAMHDIHIAYASTARPRELEKRVAEPAEAMADCRAQLAAGRQCALVFGPERSGLENDEIARCDAIVSIPTGTENPSLNLAQAVVILGYEWLRGSARATLERPEQSQPLGTKEEVQGLFDQLEPYLDAVNYFRTPERKQLMWRNLQNIFTRSQLSGQEVRTLRGMIRSLYERRTGATDDTPSSRPPDR
jgi:tRNA/rRNA methyltransferase